jgi:CheY-like chemotaxis protein
MSQKLLIVDDESHIRSLIEQTLEELEDVFVGGDANTDKLAWVSGWRKLPHLTREVETQFDYPQQFAEDIFDRIEDALRRRVSDDEANAVVQTGRLFILPGLELVGAMTAGNYRRLSSAA